MQGHATNSESQIHKLNRGEFQKARETARTAPSRTFAGQVLRSVSFGVKNGAIDQIGQPQHVSENIIVHRRSGGQLRGVLRSITSAAPVTQAAGAEMEPF